MYEVPARYDDEVVDIRRGGQVGPAAGLNLHSYELYRKSNFVSCILPSEILLKNTCEIRKMNFRGKKTHEISRKNSNGIMEKHNKFPEAQNLANNFDSFGYNFEQPACVFRPFLTHFNHL